MTIQLQFFKTVFSRFIGNRGCVISGRIWLLVFGSLRVSAFLSSYQIWAEVFWNVAMSHFSTETAWKESSISAAIFADKMLVCQIFLLFFFFNFVCVYFCIQLHANLKKTVKWDAFTCNMLPLHIRYNKICQFFIFLILSMAVLPFLPTTP